jgi:hypothetical protein
VRSLDLYVLTFITSPVGIDFARFLMFFSIIRCYTWSIKGATSNEKKIKQVLDYSNTRELHWLQHQETTNREGI